MLEELEQTLLAAMNEDKAQEADAVWWAMLREDFRKRSEHVKQTAEVQTGGKVKQ